MGPIKNIAGMASNINKADKNNNLKKVDTEKESKNNEAVGKSATKDRLEISPAARELLTKNIEATDSRFIREVFDAETLDQQSLAVIKKRMEEGYYFSPEVIDKLTDKLFDLPNFAPKPSGFDK